VFLRWLSSRSNRGILPFRVCFKCSHSKEKVVLTISNSAPLFLFVEWRSRTSSTGPAWSLASARSREKKALSLKRCVSLQTFELKALKGFMKIHLVLLILDIYQSCTIFTFTSPFSLCLFSFLISPFSYLSPGWNFLNPPPPPRGSGLYSCGPRTY
jgi:hypothetical protein